MDAYGLDLKTAEAEYADLRARVNTLNAIGAPKGEIARAYREMVAAGRDVQAAIRADAERRLERMEIRPDARLADAPGVTVKRTPFADGGADCEYQKSGRTVLCDRGDSINFGTDREAIAVGAAMAKERWGRTWGLETKNNAIDDGTREVLRAAARTGCRVTGTHEIRQAFREARREVVLEQREQKKAERAELAERKIDDRMRGLVAAGERPKNPTAAIRAAFTRAARAIAEERGLPVMRDVRAAEERKEKLVASEGHELKRSGGRSR